MWSTRLHCTRAACSPPRVACLPWCPPHHAPCIRVTRRGGRRPSAAVPGEREARVTRSGTSPSLRPPPPPPPRPSSSPSSRPASSCSFVSSGLAWSPASSRAQALPGLPPRRPALDRPSTSVPAVPAAATEAIAGSRAGACQSEAADCADACAVDTRARAAAAAAAGPNVDAITGTPPRSRSPAPLSCAGHARVCRLLPHWCVGVWSCAPVVASALGGVCTGCIACRSRGGAVQQRKHCIESSAAGGAEARRGRQSCPTHPSPASICERHVLPTHMRNEYMPSVGRQWARVQSTLLCDLTAQNRPARLSFWIAGSAAGERGSMRTAC